MEKFKIRTQYTITLEVDVEAEDRAQAKDKGESILDEATSDAMLEFPHATATVEITNAELSVDPEVLRTESAAPGILLPESEQYTSNFPVCRFDDFTTKKVEKPK